MVVSRDEALSRAQALVPALRERAPETERQRTLPEATLRDLHAAGLFRVVQPRRVGGSELPFGVLVEAGACVGQACGSSAWLLGNLASHHWMLGMWPAAAQEDVWGADPDALIASSFVFPAGKAERTPGGWRLSGRWPFSSGVRHCNWNMLGALVDGPGGPVPHLFLVPARDYRVLDTWDVLGLRGTGSHDVEMAGALVPAHRVVSGAEVAGGASPGSSVNPGALFRLPMLAMFPFAIGGALLGLAQGVVADFARAAGRRRTSLGAVAMAEVSPVQARLGEAAAAVDAAEGMMLRACADAMARAEQDHRDDGMDVRLRRDGAYAARTCVRAVDLLFEASGGGALFTHHPLERAFRDSRAAGAHAAFNLDAAAAAWGRWALGRAAR